MMIYLLVLFTCTFMRKINKSSMWLFLLTCAFRVSITLFLFSRDVKSLEQETCRSENQEYDPSSEIHLGLVLGGVGCYIVHLVACEISHQRMQSFRCCVSLSAFGWLTNLLHLARRHYCKRKSDRSSKVVSIAILVKSFSFEKVNQLCRWLRYSR